MSRRTLEGLVFLALFTACIPAANWLVQHVGTVCVPNGPCLIPVAPGLMAPSAVLVVGLAFVLRDLVQRRLGVGVAAPCYHCWCRAFVRTSSASAGTRFSCCISGF